MLSMSPSRAVNRALAILKDPNSRFHTLAALGDMFDAAHRTVAALVRRVQPNFFRTTATITLVAGTTEYNMPLDCPPGGALSLERTSSNETYPLRYVPMIQRDQFDGGEFVWSVYHNGRRHILVISPSPDVAENLTLHYQRSSVPLQYGTPSAIAATTVTLPASPTFGRRYLEADYPVGSYIMMTAGSTLGDVRQITDYNVTSRVATVDSAWTGTSTPSAMQYEVVPAWIDDDMMDAITLDAVCEAMVRDEEDPTPWVARRDLKLRVIEEQVKKLTRREPIRMTLDRGAVLSRVRRNKPNNYYPPSGW